MHMDAARFSPGRWFNCLDQIGAAAHGALLRQQGAESGIGVGLGTTLARLRACAVLYPRPAARIHAHMPSARSQPASACHLPGIEVSSLVWKELRFHRLRDIELPALPPSSAVGDVPHGPSAWACGERDQRRAYAYGLSERAGYATSSGTKPRQRCHQTHANSALSLELPNDSSVRGGPQRLSSNPAKGPAKSELNPYACDRRWTADTASPSPFARK
jgi:hypothetical protein